jgi:RNA recognition motif-containing protein
MKEGRMKDQAFITFPTCEWAQLALKEVHGYQLQEKPLIIVSQIKDHRIISMHHESILYIS